MFQQLTSVEHALPAKQQPPECKHKPNKTRDLPEALIAALRSLPKQLLVSNEIPGSSDGKGIIKAKGQRKTERKKRTVAESLISFHSE